jgi:hypothetical protein
VYAKNAPVKRTSCVTEQQMENKYNATKFKYIQQDGSGCQYQMQVSAKLKAFVETRLS